MQIKEYVRLKQILKRKTNFLHLQCFVWNEKKKIQILQSPVSQPEKSFDQSLDLMHTVE